ncbi:hypothetical protein I6H88_06655 [Elizabethkingia bruuniana]|uniref:Uncharacterized protein n=1 Tax=Elizabethkingia bruuniana TaxID=1756149 RepID=A0A7T7V1Q1_9FLAO|nr:hypothetical protein [Elizabethkingia bruuniana]KGO11809.1 hypothetical protein KS04_01775 [Elizabethkingia miricola]MDV3604843.1 hypothetical protein [Elizabethkingia anophelis]AQX86110.1 hypothetical protein AYC65_14345 [Elizabethkingia bruuniana]KUY26140.1 hypothetical protein ATB97_19475 [Elizabethkingia bruuniana]OPB67492.1 hypothetical protein BAY12_14900 [Elizabethkingia bruuniana]
MRNLKTVANNFIPKHEKEWDARLFVDEAIKSQSEDWLEIICRALSGSNEIKISKSTDRRFEKTRWIKADDGNYFNVTETFQYRCTMDRFVFHGNSHSEIYLEIIKFWISGSIFPCAGAFKSNKSKDENSI